MDTSRSLRRTTPPAASRRRCSPPSNALPPLTLLLPTLCALLLLVAAASPYAQARSVDNDLDKGITPDLIPPTLDGFEEIFVPTRNYTTLRAQRRVPVQEGDVERVIIQMTGHERDYWTYSQLINNSLSDALGGHALGHAAPPDASKLLILVPQYWGLADVQKGGLPDPGAHNETCYAGDEWAWAGTSVCGSSGLSSFDLMDDLMAWLGSTLPNLKTVVMSGHSLGGLFVDRYATFGKVPLPPGVESIFWVGNPAAPLFYVPYRPASVSELDGCPTYDTWPFGFSGDYTYDTSYFNGTTPALSSAWSSHSSRNVRHATGLHDAWRGDMGCEALAMGFAHRDRMRAWFAWVARAHGGLPRTHTVDYVEGVGHNASAMLSWPATLFRLFFESPAANLTLPSQGVDGQDISLGYDLTPWSVSQAALDAFHAQQPGAPDGSELDFTVPPTYVDTGDVVANNASAASVPHDNSSASIGNSTTLTAAAQRSAVPPASWIAPLIASLSLGGLALISPSSGP